MPKGHYDRRPAVDLTEPTELVSLAPIEAMAATILVALLPGDGSDAGDMRLVARAVKLARMISSHTQAS